MPYLTRPGRRARLGLAAICAALAAAALPSVAAAACPTTPVTKPFSTFGDLANYSLAPSGAFESGTTGWSLSRSAVATGNERFKVHASADARSLAIAAGGKATSPSFCVSIANPTFRFFARRTSGTWGVLYADVLWTDSAGVSHTTTAGALSGDVFLNWQPSSVLALGAMLPLWQPGSTLNAKLVFHTEAGGGDWTIDDVYIDPYSR